MALARDKEASSRFQSPEKGKFARDTDYNEKQVEFRKTIENYEEHQSALSRANRKLEEKNTQLQNQLFDLETEYKNRLNKKEIEIREVKSNAREEYQGQLSSMKK